MSHLKIIIIIKKRDYVRTASAVPQESAGSALYTEGCWGAPFPQHPARAQSDTHVTHSFRSSASTVALTPFPFLLVQYFPRRELHEHFQLSQYRGSRGGISGCSDSPWKGSLHLVSYGIKFGCCGRRKSCLWLVKSNVVIPSYPRQHSGTQRSRCRIPPAQDKEQCQRNSVWHMCDLGPL